MGTVVAEACVVPCRCGNVGATPHDDAAGHAPDRDPRKLGPGVAWRLALTDGPSRISQRMDTVGVRLVGAVLDGRHRAGPYPRRAQPLRMGGLGPPQGPVAQDDTSGRRPCSEGGHQTVAWP